MIIATEIGMAIGVFWHIWAVYGFWWGLWYACTWPIWLGLRVAALFT